MEGTRKELPAHLQPDESDERHALRMRKKHATSPRRCAPPPPGQIARDRQRLLDDIMVPALARVTTASRAGCAPNPPRFEVNASTHTLCIDQLDTIVDLGSALWAPVRVADHAPPLLLQTPPNTFEHGTAAITDGRAGTALTLFDANGSQGAPRGNEVALRTCTDTAPSPVVLRKSDVLEILPQLTALTTVVIKYNFVLERLPIEAMHQLLYLKYLDLSYNALKELPAALFLRPNTSTGGIVSAFPDLLELKLDNNLLSWLPREVFSTMPRLQVLAAGNNLLAGMPSTLGNHCVPHAALRTLLLHNNVIAAEALDVDELKHVAAHYDVVLHEEAEHLEVLAAGGVLPREREREIAVERRRMPLKKKHLDFPDAHQVHAEGTRVLLGLLRREADHRLEEDRQKHGGTQTLSPSESFYHGPVGWALDRVYCNMCRAELCPQFAAYKAARERLMKEREKAALGPRYRPPTQDHDFSFFLSTDVPTERQRAPVTEEAAARSAPWERDEELLWMLNEAMNGGRYGNTVPVLQPPSGENKGIGGSTFSLTSTCPPFCCASYVDVAGNKDVPLMYFICGSDVCRSALAELSTNGNAVQNFSRVDYSKLDPSDDDDDDVPSDV